MGKILGLLGAALAPPAAAFAFLQTWAAAHPVPALLLLAGYELLVLGGGFVSKLVGGTADELRNRWKDPLAKTIDEGTRRRVSGFGRRYRASVMGNLRYIDLKGLATMGFYTPELDEVFVDVSLVHSDPSKVPSDVVGHGQLQPDRHFIGDLIDQPKSVVLAVIGAPGCGKTTLLRHTALLVCRKRRRRRRVPVLLYLRDHVQAIADGTPLPDLIDRTAPPGWFERKLRAGSCVVLLDGLDEVADQQNRRDVSDWVERQVSRYPSNDFVITSRPHGYQSAPISGAAIVQVRGFTDQQVTRFVRGWYLAFEQRSTGRKSAEVARRADGEATDLLERLHENPALYELTVNPLLLTMIANVHKFRGALPGGRVDLYSEICQVLLWRRQEAKKLSSELNGDQKMTLLSGLAFSMMSRQLRDISRDQIHAEFRSSLRRMARGMDESGFLADMTSSGLLLERERDIFAFAHLTFQEYLAAHHIREKQLTHVLVGNVDDVWWRETTLLHVARTSADPIVRACLGSGTVRALSLAFDCSDQGSELAPELRAELDRMLDTVSDPTADSELRELMIFVVVQRHLNRFIRTGQGTRLCLEPVPARIYRLFLESHPHRVPDVPFDVPDQPVRGVWYEDALAFVNWLNTGAAADTTYRLPSPEELMSSPLAAKLRPLTPWTTNEGLYLHLPLIHHQQFAVDQGELSEDLVQDFSLLPEVADAVYRVRTAHDAHRSLYLPPQPKLRVLRLGQVPTTTYENAVGRAMATAVVRVQSQSKSTFTEPLARAFFDVVRQKGTTSYVVTPAGAASQISSMRDLPLTAWGQGMMSNFVDAATRVFSRTTPLTPALAAELRIAALCLSQEAEEINPDAFLWLAAGVSIMQRRADGRLPANETIVLAAD